MKENYERLKVNKITIKIMKFSKYHFTKPYIGFTMFNR